jgi:hypothetical protein
MRTSPRTARKNSKRHKGGDDVNEALGDEFSYEDEEPESADGSDEGSGDEECVEDEEQAGSI